ncbi:MAG: DAHL domain-containing protein [Pseudomonadota bacterium]
MKLNVLLISILSLFAIALGYNYYQNYQKINQEGYLSTLELINDLKQVDSELNTLMLKSRYGLLADYDELARQTVSAGNKLLEIKENNVNGYLDDNKQLQDLLKEYTEQLELKTDLVENFKSHNAVLRNSIKYAPPLGDQLIDMLEAKQPGSSNLLKTVNQALYRWALYTQRNQAQIIQTNVNGVLDLMPLFDDQTPLLEYNAHIIAVVDEQAQTQRYLQNALDINTRSTLDAFEAVYIEHNLSLQNKVAALTNYSLVFGLLALAIAIYLVWRLRQTYSKLETKVQERTRQINAAYDELKDSQQQLVQSEKMASLGQMVAGIAHEINTPLGYVNNNVSIVNGAFTSIQSLMGRLHKVYDEVATIPRNKDALNKSIVNLLKHYRSMRNEEVLDEAKELLDDSTHGLDDISSLVKNLRSFARLDKQTIEFFDVKVGINNALKLVNSVIKTKNIEVNNNLSGSVLLKCIPSQLNQVFLNIITNAAQAIPELGGYLDIDSIIDDEKFIIRFKDSGVGMDDETKSKIFDPFFTTKSVGEGTGLGMSISYKIIKLHKGDIVVDSEFDKGTTVSLVFPLEIVVEADAEVTDYAQTI